MKWLFFTLLLINIGLFVWIYPQQPPPPPEPTHLPGVKRLVLLSEVNQAANKSEQLSEWVRPPDREKEVQVGQATTSANDRPSLDHRTPAQKASHASGEAALEPPLDTANKPMPVAEAPRQFELLQPADLSPAKPEKPRHVVQTDLPSQCRRIGPLDKHTQAAKLLHSLMAMGIQTQLQMESTDEQEGYWVMIPQQENQEAAMAIVKRLHEAGISDLWRFTSGSLAHSISLGLFRDESRAEIRRKAIAAKGFDAEVRPRYRQKNTYWLDFSFSGDSPLTEADWNHIAEIYPGIEQRPVDCAALKQ